MDELRGEASHAIAEGVTILILSDRGVNAQWAPIPALLATSGVHHHLIREETPHALRPGHRNRRSHAKCITLPCSPAMAPARSIRTWPLPRCTTCAPTASSRKLHDREDGKELHQSHRQGPAQGACRRWASPRSRAIAAPRSSKPSGSIRHSSTSISPGLPAASKGSASRRLPKRSLRRHEHAYPRDRCAAKRSISTSAGSINGAARAKPTSSAPRSSPNCSTPRRSTAARSFSKFCQLIDDQQRQLLTLRGLLEFKLGGNSVPLEEVEPAAGDRQAVRHRRHVLRFDLARKRTRRWPSP